MKNLVDSGSVSSLDDLESSWCEPETFIYLPSKAPINETWIQHGLRSAPEIVNLHHFGLLTSGSTGEPKLIIGQRSRAESLARLLHTLQDSGDVQETILALPLTYCYSFVNQWLWSRVFDRKLVFTHGFANPMELKQALFEADSAMLCLVGIQVPLLQLHFPGEVFPGVMRLHFAGGRFPQEYVAQLRQMFPNAQIFNNYGCAEAMPRLAIRAADDSIRSENIGLPVPGVRFRTTDENELEFQSPYSAVGVVTSDGYKAVADMDWVSTGDLAHQESDGSWAITGRTGEVFKRHGEKVAVPQVLATIGSAWHGQAASYRARDSRGEDGHVIVVSPPPTEDQVRSILLALRARHPRAHWPLRLESIDVMPLLSNGKPDIRSLEGMEPKYEHWHQRV